MKKIRKLLVKRTITVILIMAIMSGMMPLDGIVMVAQASTTTSTITVGGTDYTLFTSFTATDGNGTNYANLVDGNTSTDWMAEKTMDYPSYPDDPDAPDDPGFPEPSGDFAGGTEDPAYVEFHADYPIIPKGYVLTCDNENAGFWKPVEWALKAKLNEGDDWTTIHSSTTTLGAGKTFEIACTNDGDNPYQYFRFEVYEVGATTLVDLDELQFYGSLPAYTHLTVKAATCTETGIKVDCYRRNSDGKYFTDETGTTELAESDVIAPIIPHTGEHHDATDVNIEYWQCSMCGTYFSNEDCTTEITEEDTKIYRTITIDNSISGLVTVFGKTHALAGETVLLHVVDGRIDVSTLKVNDGAVEVAHDGGDWYKFTMPAADVTVTAEITQSNGDGDVLTGSINHTVTIVDGANITLNNATITGGIICEGTATITLVGMNSVSGATNKAGIQIGGSGTTLTIKGDGSLTANGGDQSAGIGLSRIWNYDSDFVGGNIVIEGGTIIATGGRWGAGIGIGTVKNTNNDNKTSVQFGNITIKGGSVTAIGGDSGDGIGKGYSYNGPTITTGTVTIYDAIEMVDASSIKDFANVVYMHDETDVTTNKTDYFIIGESGNHKVIVREPVIADIDDQTYTGSEIKPTPKVAIGSIVLTKGTDYVYSYSNNTNVGTASVTVTFKGNYASSGSVGKTFTIVKVTPDVTAPTAVQGLVYSSNEQELISAGNTDFGTLQYSIDGTSYSTDIPTGTDAGNYTVYYKVVGNHNVNDVDAQSITATIKCRVSFDANGGSEAMADVGVDKDTQYTLPACAFTAPDGKAFDKWQIGDDTKNLKSAGDTITITDNTVIKATYKKTTAVINTISKVDKDGKQIDGNIEGTGSYAIGSKITFTAPKVEGYNFVGWYKHSDDSPYYTGEKLSSANTYTFTATEDADYTAVYEARGKASITVNGGSSFTVNGSTKSSQVTADYTLGSTVTVSVTADDFAYWANSYGMVLSREKTYSFTVTGADTVTAVFDTVIENKATVIFESAYGQVMARDQLASGESMSIPSVPTLNGYNAIGWDMDGDGSYDAEKDTLATAIAKGLAAESKMVTIRPLYQLKETKYTISVTNGSGAGQYNQNEVVTVTADAPEAGQKFSHWKDSGDKILSYDTTYKFFAEKDMNITAVYVADTVVVEAKGTTEIINMYKDTENNKLTFVSMSTVPEGCTINKAGVIATYNETIGTSGDGFNASTAVFAVGNSWTGTAYRYTFSKGKVNTGDTWYVRAYLVYTDASGNSHTVYGDMVSQTY